MESELTNIDAREVKSLFEAAYRAHKRRTM